MKNASPFKRNQFLHVMDGASFNVFTSMCSVGVIMPAFVKSYSGNALLLTLIPLIYDLLSSLPQPLFAFGMRRSKARTKGYDPIKRYSLMVFLNRWWFIPFSLALFLVGSRPAPALAGFYLALALFALFLSAASPTWIDLLSLTVPDATRPRFLGKREMWCRIVGIASSFLVPLFLSSGGFPGNYALLFLVSSAVAVAGILPAPAYRALYAMPPSRVPPGETFWSFFKQGMKSLLGNAKVRPFLLMYWGLSLARLGNAFYAPFIIDEVLSGFPRARSGLLLSALNLSNLVAMAIAAYVSGNVIQKRGNKFNLLMGMIAFIGAYLPLLIFRNLLTAWTCMIFLSYFTVSGMQSAVNGLMDSGPAELRTVLTSLNAFINAICMMVFYFVGSAIAGRLGYGAALWSAVVAIAALAATSLVLMLKKPRPPLLN